MSLSNRALLLPLLALGLASTACIGFGGGGSDATPTPTATATPDAGPPEAALANYVGEQFTEEYSGDCSSATLPEDEGKICSSRQGERQGVQAFVLGFTFSEGFAWVFLNRSGAVWEVVGRVDVREESADVPGVPWPLQAGATVVVTGTGDCLNVRDAPGLGSAAVDCVDDNTRVVLDQGPVEADGFQWWRLQGREAWVAADWLRYEDALPPPPGAPPAESSATPTPEP